MLPFPVCRGDVGVFVGGGGVITGVVGGVAVAVAADCPSSGPCDSAHGLLLAATISFP